VKVAVCEYESFVMSSASSGGVGDSEGLKVPVCDVESFVVSSVSDGSAGDTG